MPMFHVEAKNDGKATVRRDGVDISDQVRSLTIRIEAGGRPTIELELVGDRVEFTGSADHKDAK